MRQRRAFINKRAAIPVLDMAAVREQYNPLRDLTIDKVTGLYAQWKRGEFGEVSLMWDALEGFDDMLGTLLEKRISALLEINHNIAIDTSLVGDNPELQALAERQKQYLESIQSRIVDFSDALEWLSMASFRGFAHLEIVEDGRDIILDPVEQWYWTRPDRRGPWYYNPTTFATTAGLELVDMSRVIVREVRSPIDIVAMFAIVKKAHAESGWGGFLDVFGNPALFFEMPQGTTDDQAKLFDQIINQLLGDGRGTYPAGGKIVPVETAADKGENFRIRMESADKAMVLRATGGLLTVLAESGTGTLAGSAHIKAFEMIAGKEAKAIETVLNKQLFYRFLERKFGIGCPKLAGINFIVEADTTEKVDTITKLAAARYRISDEEASEMVGMTVTTEAPQPTLGIPGIANTALTPPVTNREPEPKDGEILASIKEMLAIPTAEEIAQTAIQVENALQNALETPANRQMPHEPQTPGNPIADPLHGANLAHPQPTPANQ